MIVTYKLGWLGGTGYLGDFAIGCWVEHVDKFCCGAMYIRWQQGDIGFGEYGKNNYSQSVFVYFGGLGRRGDFYADSYLIDYCAFCGEAIQCREVEYMAIFRNTMTLGKFWDNVEDLFVGLNDKSDQNVLLLSCNSWWLDMTRQCVIERCAKQGNPPLYESCDYVHFNNGSILYCALGDGDLGGESVSDCYIDEFIAYSVKERFNNVR